MTNTDLAAIDAHFGEQVRSERVRRGMKQADLAQRMTDFGFEFSQQTVWKVETGRRRITIGEAAGLASALETTIDAMAGGMVDSVAAVERERKSIEEAIARYTADLIGLAESADNEAESLSAATSARLMALFGAGTPARVADATARASLEKADRIHTARRGPFTGYLAASVLGEEADPIG